MTSWSFVIGPASGGMTRELATATARKATFRLTAPSEASCTLDGHDPAAAEIDELATDLHVLRSRDTGPKARLYRGRIGKTKDTLTQDQHTVDVPSLDYRAVLSRRVLGSGSQVSWTGTDQAALAMGLINQTQVKPGGDLGIAPGIGALTGVSRDRAYNLGDSIGDKVQELSEVTDGFDWDITTTGPSTLALDIWHPQRGTERGLVLEYGGAVLSLTRDVDSSSYANFVRLNGTAPDGGGADPAIQERVAADIATRPEGRWDKTFGEPITTTAALSERADWRLADTQVVRPSYTLALRPGFWTGPDQLWLGDTARLIVMSGRLHVDASLRVQEVAVAISEDGEEDVSVTIGAPPPNYRRRAALQDQRLTTLERR